MQAKNLLKPHSVLHEFKLNALRRIRDRKLSISELARITGIKQSTLHRGLFEDRELTFSNAHAIGHALGINLGGGETPRMAPVITGLDQLDALSEGRQPVWDEFILLEPSLDDSALAVDQSLFRQRLFPRRAVVVLQTVHPRRGRLVYPDHGALSLEDSGRSAIGAVAGILFRKNA
ncbi:helix-turn-helix transcriptional regulator [Chromobacterium violaceum]|uniref:helix-turn-helix domain-containing protein n=1 Tax=Chromobacterium violaceum TaxID=536 RepID=UPI00111BE2ED|nr:helix-turn-helix transcriptional regulator [Chromobacterium violaceum]MBP4050410.1 helix-turn-helix transcriptional regulator [Chromobacterium violaceum]